MDIRLGQLQLRTPRVYVSRELTADTRINASIIANQGFVARFATEIGKDGKPALASPILAGWSSIMSCGQIVGMVSLPFLSSSYGRKPAMYTFWVILVCSVLAESLARSWQAWLVGKLLAGIGVGCLQSTVPAYIAEVAPNRIRGGLLMCYSFWWSLGSFFAQVALQHLAQDHPMNYLTPVYTQWAQIGLMFLIYILVPESPAWCIDAGKADRARKELLRLYRGVPGFNVDQQLSVLSLAVEHERAIAAEQRREKWYSIFRGTDGVRTVITLWTNTTQQLIGLTLFGTFGTYFFQQAGLSDPFKIKVITTSIQIATVLILVATADRLGRRWLACGGTTLSWLACVAIGIIGVVPQSNGSTYAFVFFACLWSKPRQRYSIQPFTNSSSYRCRPSCERRNRLGLYWRDLIPETSTLHSWIWCSCNMRRRCGDEQPGSIYDQRQQVGLGPENRLVLRRGRFSIYPGNVVFDSRDFWVSPRCI